MSQQGHQSLTTAYSTCLSHDVEEKNHWDEVCQAYRQYATFAMAQWTNHQHRFQALPEQQRKVLPEALRYGTPEYSKRASLYKEAAIRNQFCLDCILRHAGQAHSQESTSVAYSTDSQMSKIASVLKSLARDWSAEGKPERDMAYQPILTQVKKYMSVRDAQTLVPSKICVPGAGVGRLACELSALGYTVQGNEFSLYMLLASDFILNGSVATLESPLQISPSLLESRNVLSSEDPGRKIAFPDMDPLSIVKAQQDSDSALPQADFSMAAGEFASIYSHPKETDKWDAVVACFFLDASPCVIEYLQVIHDMLKPGGVLINFGPLLWHWSGPAMRPDDKTVPQYQERFGYLDKKYLESVDLCWDDVRQVILNIGFEILEEDTGIRALYTADRRSMMNMNYQCASFVARKKATPTATNGGGV